MKISTFVRGGAMILLLTSGSWASDKLWEFSAVPSVTSGDYGTGTNTTTFYLPFTIKRLFEKGNLGLTLPYESITGNGAVTFQGGVPGRGGDSGGSGGSGTPGGPLALPQRDGGGDQNQAGRFTGSSNRTTNSGLGDIVLRGSYYLFDESEWAPSMDLTGRIKLPTASREKGLGTGRADEGIGADFSKEVVGDLSATVGAGYTIIGKQAGDDLRNVWNYDAGLDYGLTKDLMAGLVYEETRALIAGEPNPRDVEGSLRYRLTENFKITGSVLGGLSKGSPDLGVSLGLSQKF